MRAQYAVWCTVVPTAVGTNGLTFDWGNQSIWFSHDTGSPSGGTLREWTFIKVRTSFPERESPSAALPFPPTCAHRERMDRRACLFTAHVYAQRARRVDRSHPAPEDC